MFEIRDGVGIEELRDYGERDSDDCVHNKCAVGANVRLYLKRIYIIYKYYIYEYKLMIIIEVYGVFLETARRAALHREI